MKIKYINFCLCIVAIIGSLYIIFTRENTVGIFLKDLSIIVTITLPYIIQKMCKVHIDDKLKFIYILFVFSAHFLGVTVELYNHISYFDKVNHTLSGVLTAFIALLILSLMHKYDKNSKAFNVLWMIGITLTVAVGWEVFEYVANIFFGGDAQRVALTGVNDTMQDMIVAFLGALLVCITYVFYNRLSIFDFTNSVKKID